ncbi:YceI family protein [Pseudomonas sp. N040]|uniref:YceI family protein n=1 Tax=Pseudomonas sp. N040 TaxID=2785325 RepID=UPI0018A30CA1|nr:YceI family protein [Pseudomonas sp. N040]MBF7729604.1 YceI family protein [Pseudomonas sp. N040]MBW7013244.1 YceI family protein [Pseudomonas sp. N040]
MHRLILLLLGVLLARPLLAEWRVDAESSRISFIATKDARQAEVGRFFGLQGIVDEQGAVRLQVELDSMRTGVLVQDQRLHQELFEVSRFAFAEVTAQLDLQPITNLAPGAQMEIQLPAILSLHGVEQAFSSDLLVTRLDEHRFQIVTLTPALIDAADFGLAPALEGLRQSAGLESVSLSVPVSAVLILRQR